MTIVLMRNDERKVAIQRFGYTEREADSYASRLFMAATSSAASTTLSSNAIAVEMRTA